MRYKVTAILFLLVFSFTNLLSQEKKVVENIDDVITAAREGKMKMPDAMVYQEENLQYTIEKVKAFVQDSTMLVRNQSYLIIHKSGRVSKVDAEISECVDLLSKGCHDKNKGIARYCSKSLQRYERKYFSGQAREYIMTALLPGSRTLPNVAMLIGYLNLQESTVRLQSITSSDSEIKKNKWYAHLALARMGNKASMDYCLNVYRNQRINSEVVENMVPDLLYTRQKEAYKEVVELLYSDEKNCFSGNPDNERSIPCGFLVMEQIAPYIEGFPIETYSSGCIKRNNYQSALEELRTWFDKNKDYKIVDNGF